MLLDLRRIPRTPGWCWRPVVLLAVAAAGLPAAAQLSTMDLDDLQARGAHEGWTFRTGENAATVYPLNELCGLVPPDPEAVPQPLTAPPPRLGSALPTRFDWREVTGCPPVRNQGACGGCWAFATVGVLECDILIKDGQTVDLSEQWLVNCNQSGWGCDGGWFAHQYHLSTTDPCGGTGAVDEADLPYVAADGACACPYPHIYTIDGWAYVGNSSSVPATSAIKEAIYAYGPVSVALYADDAFQAYTDGIFNASAPGTVNHGVVLVGWDDNAGNGYWILRNSWGSGWGEDGYMRIAYGCSSIGYGACYADYPGTSTALIEVTPTALAFGDVGVGDSPTLTLTVKNVGTDTLTGTASGLELPLSIVGSADYDLAPGASQVLTVQFEPALLGTSAQTLSFSGGGGTNVTVTGTGTGAGLPADTCSAAPLIGDGTYSGDSTIADTTTAATCGGGGGHDVWWCFRPAYSGVATIDTVGSDCDTVLSVYAACGGNQLACNDDADGGPTSRVTLNVLPTSSYWVRVAGVGGATGNVVLNIATAPNPRVVAGRVIDDLGHGVAGVLIQGPTDAPSSDANGYFTGHVAYGFTGAIRPVRTGWTFDPASRSYDTLVADVDDLVFVGDPSQVAVSGRITTADGAGLGGVLLRGFAERVTSRSDGTFTTTVDYGFSGSIVPYIENYVFEPASRSLSSVTTARTNVDFEATLQTGSLQITLGPEDVNGLGAAWRVDGGEWRTSGETLLGLVGGLHVIDYAPVTDWAEPSRELVSIRSARAAALVRAYTAVAAEPDGDKPDDKAATLTGDEDEPADGGATPLPRVVAPMACGGGMVGMLPLMVGGWGVLKLRGRRGR